jgi:hypothetical protein
LMIENVRSMVIDSSFEIAKLGFAKAAGNRAGL